MKKKLFFPVLGVFIASAIGIGIPTQSNAKQEPMRVLDYTFNCVGTGGNCLPTVVVTPPPGECEIDISYGLWPGGIWVPCDEVPLD